MERKEKAFRKKSENTEAKPFNKNFYGKKVEATVGVNKNKAEKKWQPNDDLVEPTNPDFYETKNRNARELSAQRKSAASFPKMNNSEEGSGYKKKTFTKDDAVKSDFKSRSPRSNTDSSATYERKSTKDTSDSSNKRTFNKDENSPFKSRAPRANTDFSGTSERKTSKETSDSGKKRSYSEYKNARNSAAGQEDGRDAFTKRSQSSKVAGKNEYEETSPFKRKSIFDKNDDRPKPAFKKDYKPKAKAESKGPSKPRSLKDPNDDSIRLNKFISNAGICSRREADDLIKAGAVTVNGKVVTEMGHKIKRTDLVNYGGQGLKPEKQIYILLNKPKDYITTSEDPQERRTVLELIRGACKERVYPVGRLDRNTTGLLLLTNDGELTDKITHPSFKQKKIYHVELDKPVKKEHLKAIEEGIELEDGIIKVDEIKYVEDTESKKEIGITLHSGRNRIVRRIFEHFEYKVKKLDRVYFAGLTKKDLGRGRWRFLTPMEINMLKMVQ